MVGLYRRKASRAPAPDLPALARWPALLAWRRPPWPELPAAWRACGRSAGDAAADRAHNTVMHLMAGNRAERAAAQTSYRMRRLQGLQRQQENCRDQNIFLIAELSVSWQQTPSPASLLEATENKTPTLAKVSARNVASPIRGSRPDEPNGSACLLARRVRRSGLIAYLVRRSPGGWGQPSDRLMWRAVRRSLAVRRRGMMADTTEGRLPALDSLRGVAALLVVTFHCWKLGFYARAPAYRPISGPGHRSTWESQAVRQSFCFLC